MKLVFHGCVQGVGFRPMICNLAKEMRLKGYVQNTGSNVVVMIDGDAEEFVAAVKKALPPLARIDKVERISEDSQHPDFKIIPSSSGKRNSPIPPDACICEPCLSEMTSSGDRRYDHPFTNCTDCGARFSIIRDIPYDRPLTTMDEFPMCPDCKAEYDLLGDRRFHAQTISCPTCGPKYTLYDAQGKPMDGGIGEFATKLKEGSFGVIKGWGGSHLCCLLSSIGHLREWYKRKEKPFAIMARDMDAVRKYANPSPDEQSLLESRGRPIVLLEKVPEAPHLDEISPGLGNVGIMLPYSGIHFLLFDKLDIDALVMTSANPTDEPMAIVEDEILKLGADYHLLHDRVIANRCDDSLVIHHAGQDYFIRKSRGFVPMPMIINSDKNLLGMGAHENLTTSLASRGFIYPTQYIGKSSKYGVMEFLESATRHMMKLRGIDHLDAVGIDLHPGYPTRKLGKAFAEQYDAEIIEIQHHWAHAASLLVDAGLEEAVVLSLDGTGYGSDGAAWGGEILYSTLADFERVGHIQEFPLIGGEAAVKDPRRLVFALSEMLGRQTELFPNSEADVLKKVMSSAPQTTSMGRTLDAVSSALGICHTRTYDGEPAMKLEPYLDANSPIGSFETNTSEGVIQVLPLFDTLFSRIEERTLDDSTRKELASQFVTSLVNEMCKVAVEAAETKGTKHIGISGGVSYNIPIVEMVMNNLKNSGYELIRHNDVANGDGGISIGQCGILGALD